MLVHLEKILSEYRQLPGLRLTKRQVARLWALEPILCEWLLSELVNDGYLYVDASGQYALSGRAAYGRCAAERATMVVIDRAADRAGRMVARALARRLDQ